MKIIAGPRGSGRTWALAKEFLDCPGAVLFIPSRNQKFYLLDTLRQLCRERGVWFRQRYFEDSIAWPETAVRLRGRDKVFVDNLDYLDEWPVELLERRIVAATVEDPEFRIYERDAHVPCT